MKLRADSSHTISKQHKLLPSVNSRFRGLLRAATASTIPINVDTPMKLTPENSTTSRQRKAFLSVNFASRRPAQTSLGRVCRAGRRRERGGTLIEFTLVMPILLLVMTGMASFGFALHNDLVLTNAVNLGSQLLAFSRGQTTDPCATAYAAITAAAPSLTSGISVTYVINGTTYTTNTCSAGAAQMVQGANAQITASYPCNLAVLGETFSCKLQTQVTEFIQ